MDVSKGALLWATWLTENELRGRRKKAMNQTNNQTIFYQWIKNSQYLQKTNKIQHFGLKAVNLAPLLSIFPPQFHAPDHPFMAWCVCFSGPYSSFIPISKLVLSLSLVSIFKSLMTLDQSLC